MAGLPWRTVIRSDAFEDELRLLIPDAEMADEYTAAAETVLASNPAAGMPFPDFPEVWALPMAPVGDDAVWLLYSFDEEAVVFLGIRLA